MKNFLRKIPILYPFLRWLRTMYNKANFSGSQDYWEERYSSGGNSGVGSYDKFSEFKARYINDFVEENDIKSVVEFGCGDGNQLLLANYKEYIGYDVSPTAVNICRQMFSEDSSKEFKLVSDFSGDKSDLSLSLDVIYHLIEDDVFELYMKNLFRASQKYVIIYSSNKVYPEESTGAHVKHRIFTDWVAKNMKSWNLIATRENIYPFKGDSKEGSFSDFFVFQLSEH